jgi:excisionase family DNA binding protein
VRDDGVQESWCVCADPDCSRQKSASTCLDAFTWTTHQRTTNQRTVLLDNQTTTVAGLTVKGSEVVRRTRTPISGSHMEKLLTLDQTAGFLGTTRRFPRRLVDERRIQFVRVGRHIRIPVVALRDLVDSATMEPIAAGRSLGRGIAP